MKSNGKLILGTAGHIDHGKTSLIKALTGDDTDRLKEEKERGISIELGFTSLKIGDKSISIVDVPGHEKFIKTMISGATSINAVLFVISCEDGIMPQSLEHFQILEGLGLKRGVIALTKSDKAEEGIIDLIKEDIKETFKGSFLEGAKIIPTSVKSCEGLEELKNEIYNIVQDESVENDEPFRMCVDRVFSKNGVGTIVTGTIMDGEIVVGDEVLIPNSGEKGTVRIIESHGERIQCGSFGERISLNISGVSRDKIKKGYTICSKKGMSGSHYIECKLESMARNNGFKNGERIRFYTGTSEIIGRVKVISREDNYIRINLEGECFCKRWDRFYIRAYAPIENLGGGRVLNPLENPKKRYSEEEIKRLRNIESGNELENRFKSEFWIRKEEIENEEGLILVGEVYFSDESFGRKKKEISDFLEEYHRKNNLSLGISIEEIRKKTFGEGFKLSWFKEFLKQCDYFNDEDTRVSLKGHKIVLKRYQENYRDYILKELESGEREKKNLLEASRIYNFKGGEFKDLLNYMVGLELIIELSDGIIFDKKQYDYLVNKIKKFLLKNQSGELGEIRDLINKNRKTALAILEKMDEDGLTTRVENKRILN